MTKFKIKINGIWHEYNVMHGSQIKLTLKGLIKKAKFKNMVGVTVQVDVSEVSTKYKNISIFDTVQFYLTEIPIISIYKA